jgi:hypothetical protein
MKRITNRVVAAGVMAATIGATLALSAGPASATSYEYSLWMAFDEASDCHWWARNNNDAFGVPQNGSGGGYWFFCKGVAGAELWVRKPVKK